MKRNLKISLIIISIVLIVAVLLLVILNKTGVIAEIVNRTQKEEIKKEISYEVYHHVNGLTKILVVAEDSENGLEKIVYPNNELEIDCKGKNKVAFDYETDITDIESITFTAINTIGETIENTIQINQAFYENMIDTDITKETETQKCLNVNFKTGSTTKQYKIGNSSSWVNYTGAIRLDDYQILETLGTDNKEINVELRQIDQIGNEIITQVKYVIDDGTEYKNEDTVIEGESILACVENNTLESGNYIFKVTGTTDGQTEETIEYPVELYNYDENANYVTNLRATINGRNYTGFGDIDSEKRMLVLKYNGDLTINSGVAITPTGTKETINGATYLCTKKGMLIYCAGTLTNNGTITMTARGTVNQEGENVYLFANADNTYEYVPALGAEVVYASGSNGNTGMSGTERRTAGGGSGGYSGGAGGAGTSYSGGAGGGGCWNNSGTAGSSIGGPGGIGRISGGGVTGAGGGAGNPGGSGAYTGSSGETGTGGLLVIYADSLINNSTISSDGSNGGYTGGGNGSGGGGSGGGSINLFYNTTFTRGNINCNGGAAGNRPWEWKVVGCYGGAGGSGSITIGNISTGTFLKDE